MPTDTHNLGMGWEVARDVAVFIGTLPGMGTFGTTIKVDETPPEVLPDAPVELICVTGNIGYQPAGDVLTRVEITITVREKKKSAARAKILQIHSAMHLKRPPLDRFYMRFTALADPRWSKESNNRYEMELHLGATGHPKTSAVL